MHADKGSLRGDVHEHDSVTGVLAKMESLADVADQEVGQDSQGSLENTKASQVKMGEQARTRK